MGYFYQYEIALFNLNTTYNVTHVKFYFACYSEHYISFLLLSKCLAYLLYIP